jgi:hypothetical protein
MSDIEIELQPGQVHSIEVLAGTVVHLRSGELVIHESPQWLAETMMVHAWPLRAGHVHVLELRGWIRLEARSAATLMLRPRESAALAGQALDFAKRMIPAVRRGPRRRQGVCS